jgi:cholesterol oxidase
VTLESDTFRDDDEFDAVVIGSGFGGSVAAWRLKKQCPDKKVLVLERGMPYPPGSFARTPRAMRQNFWDPSSSLYGLFEVWSFAHAKAIVSSGLGGGSLIYANVMLEKPAETFKADPPNRGKPWPWPTDPAGFTELSARYAQIRERLGANPLPQAYVDAPSEASAAVPKTKQFLEAARAAGLREPQLAELAVTFASAQGEQPGAPFGDPHENLHRRQRHSCTLAGECDLGCNEGAKNTLDYTYLSDFHKEEGQIRTCCEAVYIARQNGRYVVRYAQHLQARSRVEKRARADGKLATDTELLDGSRAEMRRVKTKVLLLAAGTFGSPGLLLASRTGLPRLSRELGRRFSSNGDLLTVARDCTDRETDRQRDLAPSRGPVITAYATRHVDGHDLWMQDAGGPVVSEWGWQLSELSGDLWAMRDALWRMVRGKWRGRVSGDIARGLGATGASSAMLPLLTMGRDTPGGEMWLDADGLGLDWDPADSRDYFSRAEETAASVAEGLGGKLAPRWLRRRLWGLTSHPLGGCPMGTGPQDGVVGPDGQVFGYPGLFVADGSVMPGPVGANPSLTIAALADHIAQAAVDFLCSGGS